MTPAEQVSVDVWTRLMQSRELVVRLGEETLTDILTLDFTRLAGKHRVKMFQTPKLREAKTGTDLEVSVNTGGGKAFKYAIQAKKLYPDGRYPHLKSKVGSSGRLQLDVLEHYAKTNGVLPYYLLFNYVDHVMKTQHWHCCQSLDEDQLGCTLVPSWHVRRATEQRGCRTFAFLHSIPEALPFRCRFDCPLDARWDRKREAERIRSGFHEQSNTSRGAPDWWKGLKQREHEWPEWLWRREGPKLSMDDVRMLWPELTSDTLESPGRVKHPREPSARHSAPRRILLVGTDTGSGEPDW